MNSGGSPPASARLLQRTRQPLQLAVVSHIFAKHGSRCPPGPPESAPAAAAMPSRQSPDSSASAQSPCPRFSPAGALGLVAVLCPAGALGLAAPPCAAGALGTAVALSPAGALGAAASERTAATAPHPPAPRDSATAHVRYLRLRTLPICCSAFQASAFPARPPLRQPIPCRWIQVPLRSRRPPLQRLRSRRP